VNESQVPVAVPPELANSALWATGWLDFQPLNLKIPTKGTVATSLSFNGIYVLTEKLEITKTEVFTYLQFRLWICSHTKDPQVQNSSIIYSFKVNF